MIKNKKYFTIFIIVLAIAFLFFLNYVYQNKVLNERLKTNKLIEISQNSLKSKIENDESFLVYIGRPSCPDCEKFEPILREKLNKADLSMYYYNTESKASEKKSIKKFLEVLNVDFIPTIISVYGGEIKDIINVENKKDIKKIDSILGGD